MRERKLDVGVTTTTEIERLEFQERLGRGGQVRLEFCERFKRCAAAELEAASAPKRENGACTPKRVQVCKTRKKVTIAPTQIVVEIEPPAQPRATLGDRCARRKRSPETANIPTTVEEHMGLHRDMRGVDSPRCANLAETLRAENPELNVAASDVGRRRATHSASNERVVARHYDQNIHIAG